MHRREGRCTRARPPHCCERRDAAHARCSRRRLTSVPSHCSYTLTSEDNGRAGKRGTCVQAMRCMARRQECEVVRATRRAELRAFM